MSDEQVQDGEPQPDGEQQPGAVADATDAEQPQPVPPRQEGQRAHRGLDGRIEGK